MSEHNHPNIAQRRRSSLMLPPLSPVGSPPQSPYDHDKPTSPTSPNAPNLHNADEVDWQRNKFGDKVRMIRRMSSTEWEHPMMNGNTGTHEFAKVTNDDEKFHAQIDLNFFPAFEVDEIDVDVYGFDVLVHARKENPNNPNSALSEISRQYRLPDDVDLETVKLKKNKATRAVSVDANKTHGFGKPVQYAVFDATKHETPFTVI
uniref:SHSP domain-containing protein n=1 Tax=Panagrellus redivivus TaxID=6233 RepID=A0A7E4W9S3_PANRE